MRTERRGALLAPYHPFVRLSFVPVSHPHARGRISGHGGPYEAGPADELRGARGLEERQVLGEQVLQDPMRSGTFLLALSVLVRFICTIQNTRGVRGLHGTVAPCRLLHNTTGLRDISQPSVPQCKCSGRSTKWHGTGGGGVGVDPPHTPSAYQPEW